MKREDGKMHQMVMIGKGEGTEEWFCPHCGRRLLLNWEPQFEKIILEAGDQEAMHSGELESSAARPVHISPAANPISPEVPDTSPDTRWLLPWMRWLDAVGFDRLWSRDL